MLLRLQYQCEFNETNPCFNASANVLYTEQARELAQSGGIDDVALEEMSEAEKQAELAKREAEKASQAFQKWISDNVPFLQNDRNWIDIFHQLILFIIIIGRWMLPKAAGVTRDQLSQILLIFIGVGADILEFVTETMKEFEVRCEQFVIILMLGFWSWSLVQFVLVVTGTTKARTKMTEIFGSQGGSPVMVIEEEVEMSAWEAFWSNPEVWSIMTTMVLQDGPFLGMRLYICFGRNVMKPTLIFFTLKNGIVMLLELYRLVVIATHRDDDPADEEEEGDEELPEDDLQKKDKKKKPDKRPPPPPIEEPTPSPSPPPEPVKKKKEKKNKKDKNKDVELPGMDLGFEVPDKKKKKKKKKNKE